MPSRKHHATHQHRSPAHRSSFPHRELEALRPLRAGDPPPLRILPAYVRLYRAGRIDDHARDAADELADAWVAAYQGEHRPGIGGGNIITHAMFMADRVRRASAVIGTFGLALFVASCVDCRPGALVAWRLLGWRPRTDATPDVPTASFWRFGREALDDAIVPLFVALSASARPHSAIDKKTVNA